MKNFENDVKNAYSQFLKKDKINLNNEIRFRETDQKFSGFRNI